MSLPAVAAPTSALAVMEQVLAAHKVAPIAIAKPAIKITQAPIAAV